MSVLKGLREIGWNGNPIIAPQRHSIIIALFELSKYFDFRVIGEFPKILFTEHKGEEYINELKQIDLLIPAHVEIQTIHKAFHTIFFSVYIIDDHTVFVDDTFKINTQYTASLNKTPPNEVMLKFTPRGYELVTSGDVKIENSPEVRKRKRSAL